MADDGTAKGKLPGNHGQFGKDNATEEYKPLEDAPAPTPAREPRPAGDAAAPAGTGRR